MLNEFKNKIENHFKEQRKHVNKNKKNPSKKEAELNRINIDAKIFRIILAELEMGYKTRQNKILLDSDFWSKLSEIELFRKRSIKVHNFSKFLIKKKWISSSSFTYNKNNRFIAVNKLSKPFLNTDLNTYDKVFALKDNLIKEIETIAWSEHKSSLIYIYLKLFSLTKIPDQYLQYLCRASLFQLNETVMAFIFTLDTYKDFTPIKTLILDKYTNQLFKNLFFIEQDNIMNTIDHIFANNIDSHIGVLNKYLKENDLTKIQCNNVIAFNYQLSHTPLALTCHEYTNFPRISLFELDYLFKNKIDKRLLNLEKKNFEIFKEGNNENEDELDEIDLDAYLDSNFEVFDEFKKLKRIPQKKEILGYLNKWYKYLNLKRNKVTQLITIFDYALFLLQKADKRINNKPITPKTLAGYFQILFDFCFNYEIHLPNPNEATKAINDNLEHSNLKTNSKRRYRRVINHYKTFNNDTHLSDINTIINYNKSIIFTEELDKLFNAIQYQDRNYKQEILKKRRIAYAILLFYTGLRKNELTSRLVRDIDYYGDNTFEIDVNKDGIDKINKYLKKGDAVSLKSRNAKRKIVFNISNVKHFNIIKNYLDLIEKNGNIFLFPELNKSNYIGKYRAIKLQSINNINPLLQKITKRYTTLHSFRHTYATNEMHKILTNKDKKVKDIFELAVKMGHRDPNTTITSYIHLDLLKILLL